MDLVRAVAICKVEVQEVVDWLEVSLKRIGAEIRQKLIYVCISVFAVPGCLKNSTNLGAALQAARESRNAF